MDEPSGAKASAAGFTLLEVLVVVALLGVLASLAAPSMSALRRQHLLQAQAEDLLGSLMLARSEALRRQIRVTVCARSNDKECDAQGRWKQGWLVFVDANDSAWRDADEPILEVHAPLQPAITLSVSNTAPAYFSYTDRGRSSTVNGAFMAGTWALCWPGLATGWQVVSNALGQPRLQKYSPTSCG